ncbi:MAG TPA: type II toxin-antitoxin system HipA family toxin [Kofleriaceae bacterium]|jgi:serine/threonine-protein kinase HipA
MIDQLEVRYDAAVVGIVRADADQFCFRYAVAWLRSARAFPISLSLPLGREEIVGGAAHTFFSNLLPEGGVRDAVCARLGISPENDFALLVAIGGDCAGALSLVEPGRPVPDSARPHYERLTDARIASLLETGAVPLLAGGPRTRLSLAGAQDKVPVVLVDDALHLPRGTAASTHILKLPNRRYPHLLANEAFAMGLGQRLGLDVAPAELWLDAPQPLLLVTRYDRITEAGTTRRLHQEDFCQATARPSSQKYEAEGGPTFAAIIGVVRDATYEPLVDVARLLDWQAFNLVIGNADGHAKNLSLLYGDDGTTRLAPFYDLLSMREYKRVDRKLALRIGGGANPDEIGYAEWQAQSKDLGIGLAVLLRRTRELAERTLAELPAWRAVFRERYGAQPILQTLPKAIAARARRLLRSVAPPR